MSVTKFPHDAPVSNFHTTRHRRWSRRSAFAGMGIAAALTTLWAYSSEAQPQKPKPIASPASTLPVKPVAAAPAAQSALAGAWKITWLTLNKVSALNIGKETDFPGVARFESAMTDPSGVKCGGNGFAAQALGGVFPLGGDVNMVGVSDYLRIASTCGKGQILIEALGVGGASLQWIGRAVIVDEAGHRSTQTFLASR